MQVHAVGDQLDVDGGVQQGADGAGVTVVERAHRVEEVRAEAGTRVEGGPRLVVRRVGVADRGDDAGVGELPHGLDPAGQLGREGDHAYGAVPRGEEGMDRGRVRVGERARLVGAGALRAQPGSLEVDAGEPTVLHQQGELADGVGHPLRGVGDQAGRHRRRPVGEVGVGDDRRRVRRTEVERRAPAAVHVEVDEPGDDGRPAEVDVGLARWRPLADLDDAIAVEEQPPRREDPRRGDHLSCSEDHVRPCCPARGSSHRRPGRPRPHDRAC